MNSYVRGSLASRNAPSRPHACDSAMATPKCSSCDIDRKLVYAETSTRIYEIRSYRCSACKTILRLVERRHSEGRSVKRPIRFMEKVRRQP